MRAVDQPQYPELRRRLAALSDDDRADLVALSLCTTVMTMLASGVGADDALDAFLMAWRELA